MNTKIKKILRIFLIFIIIICSIFIAIISSSKQKNEEIIASTYNIFNEENIQNKIENIDNIEELSINNENFDIIGILKIDKIGFEGLVYEGTNLDILEKGVGHFENTPTINGNVCLAAHNTNKYWSKLYTLKNDDTIIYTSMLGTKTYKVFSINEIEETNWEPLENTDENTLTLITCIKGKSNLRLCVQALEIK